MLLEVVALAGDVAVDLFAVGEADAGHLAHSRVRLLGGGGIHAHAHAATLGARIEGGRLALVLERGASLSYELLNGRHSSFLFIVSVFVCLLCGRQGLSQHTPKGT